jgi:zinc and cadmium transporter
MSNHIVLTVLSALSLPLLSFLALFLRRNILQGTTKMAFLFVGVSLLGFSVFSTFNEHFEELGLVDVLVATSVGVITFFILSRFHHSHTHTQEHGGAKGIVISEAFHSLIDGAVIGGTYLISPVLGYAATLGIVVHELPKILGTLGILRSLGLSVKKTIFYGMLAQGGSPVAALLVYLLGKQIDHEQFKTLEIASITSLGVIVLWILFLEFRFHKKHDHPHH